MVSFLDCVFCQNRGKAQMPKALDLPTTARQASIIEKKPAIAPAAEETEAAIKMQALQRGRLARVAPTAEETEAAIKMQAMQRGRLARVQSKEAVAPVPVVVTVTKVPDRFLGVVLADVAAGHKEAGLCVVAIVDQGGLVADTKQVRAGDLIRAVNDEPVQSFQHATQLIKLSPDQLHLTITKEVALPRGWVLTTEETTGRPYYKRGHQRTHFHPLTQP